MEKLVIGHFYPDLLNLYGDRGNVLALMRRAQLRGIEVEVKRISIGDELKSGDIDIGFIGGGQDSEQNIMADDMRIKKGPVIKQMIEDGVVFLTVCGGYQMLGQYYEEHDGKRIECLGAMPHYTKGEKERFINDTVYEIEIGGKKVTVAGFENHSGRTYLGEGEEPFMKVIKGHGNNGEDGLEGVRYKNTFGTYSHGSLLPKNPAITDMLLELALKRKYGADYELSELATETEDLARKQALDYINGNTNGITNDL
ncbi:MAG: glutamine amidotransferase [Saccharofermentans sp.]|nr:glutamine amidotransferase [Saccharofermentans sp.]